MKALLTLALAAALLMPLGCSSSEKKTQTAAKSLSGTDETIFLGDTVEKNYDPNVIMKRAESFFDKEEYAEAVIEYQHFLELHRVHTLAPYAQFKLGESHFKQIKTVDRDTEPVYKALESFEKLRKDWPATRWDADAQDRIKSCHNMIAENYLLVGQFYFRREAYLAAAHRFEAIINLYPELEVAATARYELATAYAEMGANDWAREQLIVFMNAYPSHEKVGPGKKLLAQLNQKTNGSSETMVAQNTTDRPRLTAGAGPNDLPELNGQAPSVAGMNAFRDPAFTPTQTTTFFCRLGFWC